MLSVIVQVKRAPHLSRDEFLHYWRDRHATLVTSVPEFMRYVRRYSQYHPMAEANEAFFGGQSEYDGTAILWFDSLDDVSAAFNDPTYLSVIKPDEETFVDLDNCSSTVVEELVMWGGGMLYSLPRREEGEPVVRPFS
jgi:uncharacterized protein (TIGR02118 family)